VPTLFNALCNLCPAPISALENLTLCISGGAPLPPALIDEFAEICPATLIEGYGLSETSPVLTCNPPTGVIKPGSIGVPLPQTIISIRSLEDPSVEMPQGEKGEICAKGPQVMPGYWNAKEETDNVFVGDYFRTGDIGYMDEDGYTFIVDRLKDLILCSGFNVYPRHVEDAIYQHTAVEEVTVIGIPDDYRGEAPKAFVKLKKGQSLTKEQLLEFLSTKLSKIELPEEIEFRDELPKTMVGKLSKKELRDE
jgi:long-chain acyl-CoA synthetase